VAGVAGCGSDDGGTEPAASAASPQPATTQEAPPPDSSTVLAEPLLPRCGVDKLGKPQTEPKLNDGRTGWQIVYQNASSAPRVPGQPSVVTIVEQPPAGPRGSLQGGRDVTVAGHKVSFRDATSETPSNVAQWKTRKARYVVLADGAPGALERIIGCLP
jgi:hypothetical protein